MAVMLQNIMPSELRKRAWTMKNKVSSAPLLLLESTSLLSPLLLFFYYFLFFASAPSVPGLCNNVHDHCT